MGHSRALRIAAGLALGALCTAEAANPKNYIERLRDRRIVYVGMVGDLAEVGRTARQLQLRATLRVLAVPRAPAGGPRDTASVSYWSWDDRTPPMAGGVQYRLAPGALVVVFADAFASDAPPAYVMHGTRDDLVRQLGRHRVALAGWTAEQIAFNEIDEAARRRQLALYDALLLALRSVK